jgi:hypothetical protein
LPGKRQGGAELIGFFELFLENHPKKPLIIRFFNLFYAVYKNKHNDGNG